MKIKKITYPQALNYAANLSPADYDEFLIAVKLHRDEKAGLLRIVKTKYPKFKIVVVKTPGAK